MPYFDYMEDIKSGILDKVLNQIKKNNVKFTKDDVKNALNKDTLTFYDYRSLLSTEAENHLEEIAERAKEETKKHFGNSVSLYTPLYISNFCENICTYCGFNCENDIVRGKLTVKEIENELKAISQTGLKEILLLTGESRKESNVEYIGEAVKLSKKYFSAIGVEIYPLNTDEYAYINKCGADFVSIYQETYNTDFYEKYHPSGPKQVFQYRFNSQERAIKGGMRGVSFGALLGLGNFRDDVFAAGIHAYYLQQKYPRTEISFSVPRIRKYINRVLRQPSGFEQLPLKNNSEVDANDVGEKQLLLAMLAFRIFMPFASIAISTRERPVFRDNVIGLAANKISAGVKVGVGGHDTEQKGDEQFEIADTRTVSQIHSAILEKKLQPVYTDYISMI